MAGLQLVNNTMPISNFCCTFVVLVPINMLKSNIRDSTTTTTIAATSWLDRFDRLDDDDDDDDDDDRRAFIVIFQY